MKRQEADRGIQTSLCLSLLEPLLLTIKARGKEQKVKVRHLR